ncbi:MAG: hypothetical protein ABSF84_15355 [Acidimicrobiales bacterium]
METLSPSGNPDGPVEKEQKLSTASVASEFRNHDNGWWGATQA